MKINEKNLCAYAISSTVAADKEGYLMKKGDINKAFHKRWFVLKGNLLFYFEKQSDKEPLGMIILEGCTIEPESIDAQFCFKIVYHGAGNRSYILCAESQESMEFWMKSLACASYDYMKSMVNELQRQLKETQCKMEKISISNESASLISFNECNSACPVSPTPSPNPPPRSRPRPTIPTRSRNGSYDSSGNPVTSPQSGYPGQSRISFNALHNLYGRPILADRSQWNYDRKLTSALKESTVSNASNENHLLITL